MTPYKKMLENMKIYVKIALKDWKCYGVYRDTPKAKDKKKDGKEEIK